MPRFSIGVNYWPRRSPAALAGHFDDGEVREDFSHMAQLGLDAVRIFVAWDAVQPRSDAVDSDVLDRLAEMISTASDYGLRVLPTLGGEVNGEYFVPRWADAMPNLYAGPLLDAQLRLTQAVSERLREHAPAIVAWDIGHAFTRVRAPRKGKVSTGDHGSVPVSEREVSDWSKRLASVLRGASLNATAGTWYRDLTTDTNVRLGSLCAPFAFASMQGSNLRSPFARSRFDPEALPFLAMLTAAFSFKAVLMTAIGHPSCPPGKFSAFERFPAPGEPPLWQIEPDDAVFSPYPCLTDDEQSQLAAAVLPRLHADGRLGAYWWCWRDSDEPGSDAPWRSAFGLLRADGSEKPVAAALAAFARTSPEVQRARDMPMISSTYYYRTLPTSMATLYEAFLSWIAPRRAEAQDV
jgi:hypothetical protein